MKLNFPPARKLPDPPGSTGQRVAEPEPLAFHEDGLTATTKSIRDAAREWPQGRAEDFRQIGKRLWVDEATSIEYRHVRGCPLLALGSDSTRDISLFIVSGGRLVFLARSDVSDIRVGGVPGPIISCRLPEPNAQPQVIW